MTCENLVTAKANVTKTEARKLLHKNKIERMMTDKHKRWQTDDG